MSQHDVSSPSVIVRSLPAQELTPEAFRPFGQVIYPNEDGTPFGPEDAQLQLQNGIPRFYIMRLTYRGQRFHRITRHQQCTQCLGALAGQEWLIAVAPPGPANTPDLEALRAFRIPGNCFIKLEVGTWHAGPYFEPEAVDFYNLELSDTNITDHETCNLASTFALEFEIV
ncbi:MAG TPA: ureidoglycolate lyase [Trichocoleus sp.]